MADDTSAVSARLLARKDWGAHKDIIRYFASDQYNAANAVAAALQGNAVSISPLSVSRVRADEGGAVAGDGGDAHAMEVGVKAVSPSLSNVSAALAAIVSEIRTQIIERNTELLSSTDRLGTLHTQLLAVRQRALEAQEALRHIHQVTISPFEQVGVLTERLARLQRTSNLLWQCFRLVQMCELLRSHMHAGTAGFNKKTGAAAASADGATAAAAASCASTNVGPNSGTSNRALFNRKGTAPLTTSVRSIAKAASALCDIEAVLAEHGSALKGIHVVEEERPYIEAAGARIRNLGKRLLWKGIDGQNQTEIGAALQVFFNLGDSEMKARVDDAINRLLKQFTVALRRKLDMTTFGSNSGAAEGSGAASRSVTPASSWRLTLWNRAELLVEDMFGFVQQVSTLQNVLKRKRDPLTQTVFQDAYNKVVHSQRAAGVGNGADCSSQSHQVASPVLQRFLADFVNLFEVEMKAIASRSAFVKNVFVCEYPRLVRTFGRLSRRLGSSATALHGGGTALEVDGFSGGIVVGQDGEKSDREARPLATHSPEHDRFLQCLTIFEQGYLQRCTSKLREPLDLIFGRVGQPSTGQSNGTSLHTDVPSRSDVGAFIRCIHAAFDALSVRKTTRSQSQADGTNYNEVHADDHVADDVSDLVHARKLQFGVVACVANAVRQFAEHCSHLMKRNDVSYFPHSVDTGSSTVMTTTDSSFRGTFAQRTNAELHVRVCQVQREFSESAFFSRHGLEALSEKRRQCWLVLQRLAESIMDEVVRQCADHLRPLIESMHEADFTRASQPAEGGHAYVRHLQVRIQFFCQRIIPMYLKDRQLDTGQRYTVLRRVRLLAVHLESLFLRVCSLITPLHEQARLKIAVDVTHFEAACSSLMPRKLKNDGMGKSGDFGSMRDFEQLRLYKIMLFMRFDGDGVAGSNDVDSDAVRQQILRMLQQADTKGKDEESRNDDFNMGVVFSDLAAHERLRLVVMQHLLSACSVPFAAPHCVKGWNVAEYIAWVRDHTLPEILSLLHEVLSIVERKMKIPLELQNDAQGRAAYIASNFPEVDLLHLVLGSQ